MIIYSQFSQTSQMYAVANHLIKPSTDSKFTSCNRNLKPGQ